MILSLDLARCSIAGLALDIPQDLTFDEWVLVGGQIARRIDHSQFFVGDWANYGELKWGQLKSFAAANGLNYSSLRQYAWVSANVEKSTRVDKLSWHHHLEVAPLPPEEQKKWLALAVKNGWPVAELRRQIRRSKGTIDANQPDHKPLPLGPTEGILEAVSWLTARPSDFWTDSTKEFWRNQLQPLHDFYLSLS